jgi:hypothetical protein
LAKMQSQVGRQGQSRVRPGQVADAMRVRAGVAARVASGDPAASKGKSAGGCSSFKQAGPNHAGTAGVTRFLSMPPRPIHR